MNRVLSNLDQTSEAVIPGDDQKDRDLRGRERTSAVTSVMSIKFALG